MSTSIDDDAQDEIVQAVVCLSVEREIWQAQISRLQSTNRALLLVAMTAYFLGAYCGFIAALERVCGP